MCLTPKSLYFHSPSKKVWNSEDKESAQVFQSKHKPKPKREKPDSLNDTCSRAETRLQGNQHLTSIHCAPDTKKKYSTDVVYLLESSSLKKADIRYLESKQLRRKMHKSHWYFEHDSSYRVKHAIQVWIILKYNLHSLMKQCSGQVEEMVSARRKGGRRQFCAGMRSRAGVQLYKVGQLQHSCWAVSPTGDLISLACGRSSHNGHMTFSSNLKLSRIREDRVDWHMSHIWDLSRTRGRASKSWGTWEAGMRQWT